ncbi:MAG: hypothetical protein GF308_00860 [Candidatus Heimdallarchaeota archaeon]|nr:hypothetical protein [Candidatus Heimdallarchaeota archaeon]
MDRFFNDAIKERGREYYEREINEERERQGINNEKVERNPFIKTQERVEREEGPFTDYQAEKEAVEKTPSRELKKEQKLLKEQKETTDKIEKSELDNDFYYLTGANHVYLRMDPKKGYSFEYDVANEDWLKESIKSRLEQKMEKDFTIKPREETNTYQLRGYSKDFVQKLDEYQNNPDRIREGSAQNQDAWLSGFIDANATIDATEVSEPAILLSNESQEKLDLVQDLLEEKGIEAKLEEIKVNPRLKITGSKNFRNLKNNIRMENAEKRDELKELIIQADFYERPERLNYGKERQQAGIKFEKLVEEIVEYLRPDMEKYELKDPTNAKGERMNPDFVVKSPNGEIEYIETKLGADDVIEKDRDYLGNKEIDKGTILHWEGEQKEKERHYGKNLSYEPGGNIYSTLEDAKKNTKSIQEREKVSEHIENFRAFDEELDEIAEKYGKTRTTVKGSKGPHSPSLEEIEATVREDGGLSGECSEAPSPDENKGGGGGKESKNIAEPKVIKETILKYLLPTEKSLRINDLRKRNLRDLPDFDRNAHFYSRS